MPHASVITFLLTYAENSMTFELYVKLMLVIAVYWSSKGHSQSDFSIMTTLASNHVAILDSNPAIWLVYLYLLVHNTEIWLALSHSAPVFYHLFPKKISIAWRLVTPSFFLKGYEVLSKYVALYAANVIKDGNTLKALDLFCKYGAPANPQVN